MAPPGGGYKTAQLLYMSGTGHFGPRGCGSASSVLIYNARSPSSTPTHKAVFPAKALGRRRQEDYKVRVLFGYTVGLRPAFNTGQPVKRR